jgi:diguanylate cyclase (GGDEF)-like protein/PAS domain S-box-containing protein
VTVIQFAARRSEVTVEKASLLLVDDEELNLDMLSRRLEKSGSFTVQVASSGANALRMVRENSFDLVLLDQMMPGMSGSEVLRELRANYSPEVLPVIMVTAVAESAKVADALESGANDYITKPVDFKVALARIRAQLARKRTEAALRHSEERYAMAARASRDGLWDWNLTTGNIYFSPRWKEMLGLDDDTTSSPDEWFSRIVKADRQTISDVVQAHLNGTEDVLQCNYRMRHADGSLRWMSCRGIVTRDATGLATRLAGSQSDITDEKTHDALTGVPNRLLLVSQLECILEDIANDAGSVVASSAADYAVLFLDLDGFKTINDSLGHAAGDHLLKAIAARLRLAAWNGPLDEGVMRAPLVARMGGDEFAILLEGNMTRSAVEAFARDVQRLMRGAFDLNGQVLHCVFSIGVAVASERHHAPEDVLREADMAMYAAKLQNRGGVVVFDQSMRDAATLRLELEEDLRSAVRKGEFDVVYQPKVDIGSGRTYGVEALVRWNHPKRGILSPGFFIPLAEETGIIVEIGKWIRRRACAQVVAWQKEFPTDPPLELSVNLSPREFKQKNLADEIKRTLVDTGLPPASFHLEVTEGVLFEDMSGARQMLHALKNIGIKLDIDDFGTGYSSLKYLRELPFDTLKIDQYFTAALDPKEPSSGELIRAIVSMADNLGLEVVAEGIETEMQSFSLQMLGCRQGQGYYFSKPVGTADMDVLLASQQKVAQSAGPGLHPSIGVADAELPCRT